MPIYVLLLLSTLLGACTHISPSSEWDPAIIRGQLSNGLEYRLVNPGTPKDASNERLDIRLTVQAGSLDEEDRQVGVAHLLEHLNFYNQGELPARLRDYLQQHHWQQGLHYNAVTNYERTQYLLSPPRGVQELERALQALATLAFAADFTATDLEAERPIVIEEWRGGLGVAQRMNDQRTAAQRHDSRYPARATIGNREAILGARLEALRDYQERWYRPNNMTLSAVGDIDPERFRHLLERYFASALPAPLSERGYRELTLAPRLHIVRVQDAESGSNQLALMFRGHEAASRAPGLAGLRERLIDRMTLDAATRQLRRQAPQDGVSAFAVRKNQIGRYSSVLAIAATPDGRRHDDALSVLLKEIERLRQRGIQHADGERARQALRETAQGMLDNAQPYSFEQWVTRLNDATLREGIVQSRTQIAQSTLRQLDGITLDELNQRLRHWLSSPDQILQYSAPGLSPLTLASNERFNGLRTHWQGQRLEPPQPLQDTPSVDPVDAPSAGRPGHIVQRKTFPAQQVEQWQLDNGDRLVWLKPGFPLQRAYLQAETGAGELGPAETGWRQQMASQLLSRSAPFAWSLEQRRQWQSSHGLNLSLEHNLQRLEFHANAPSAELGALLALYRGLHTAPGLDEAMFDASRLELQQRLESVRHDLQLRQNASQQALLNPHATWQMPTQGELQALSIQDIRRDWQRLARHPVTYYLLADIPRERLESLVREELAAIPRAPARPGVDMASGRQAAGMRSATLRIAREPRATLNANSYSELPWSPEDAAAIRLLTPMANRALKQALRSEASGVYRLVFDSSLNQDSNRVESRLTFSSAPARVEELWRLALKTLRDLPRQLSPEESRQALQALANSEQERLTDPGTQLQRLVLGYRAWGTPDYLSRQAQLVTAIDHRRLQRLAGRLFDERNSTRLLLLPGPPEATVTSRAPH
ncbi:insulinase family protein [Stutzerimonas kirkiae]|uniref:Insulinase family protein n=1 Tax=Stutzerimonas kirkiae TaxID=2211392 RepID=A0A4V6MXB1_9GAMM|nr:insulinase family protein [Stutzerimonas kirkiae]TBU96024.1 insulinase family protein [Stutzerimonas kirkiae]TBV03145.1 insulinase family protein [Stutzerimonas kirkiae]